MTNQFLRPYAAKAIVTHEFDTDHLNIWVTFRFPMDTTKKPANGLWIPTIDDVEEATTDSAWLDEFTILLTIGDIAQAPVRVLLTYDGPSELLTTTWDKQWEPWTDILSTGPVTIPYGNYKGNEIDWSQVAAQNVWYTVSDADISIDYQHKMFFQNNQEFKVDEAGKYHICYYLTLESSIANKHVLTAPEINGVEQLGGRNHVEFGRANEEGSIAGSSIVDLSVDDLVSIGVSTPDIGNPTLTIDHIGLTLIKIAET